MATGNRPGRSLDNGGVDGYANEAMSSETPSSTPWNDRLARHGFWLLCVVVVLVYLPSLGGGYLPYDDDWLIERNPLLDVPLGPALNAFFVDLSRETRLTLGAEYLPLRDLSHWLEVAAFGKSPLGMRLVQLGLYLGALGFLHSALRRSVSPTVLWVTLWAFALHPTHVESVAWIAGRKDVLALSLICGALACYAGDGRARWWAVPLVMAAALSKSMSVISPGLLLATDLLAKRRPTWRVLGVALGGVGFVFGIQWVVGRSVGMVGGPLQDHTIAFWTMGEVWLRYVLSLIYPPSLSLVYDVTKVASISAASVLGWLGLVASWTYGFWRLRSGATFALGTILWAWLPLAPVSQVLFPLQNVMADRYLWLTTVALGLGLGALWSRHLVARVTVSLALLVLAVGTVHRAALFGDPVALFTDATLSSQSPRAPYLLGFALQQQGEPEAAIDAYIEAVRRNCDDCSDTRRAANNLATLYVESGQLEAAEAVLRRSTERFPDEPKAWFNLVKVLARRGHDDTARRLFDTISARFPNYQLRAP